MIWNSPQGRRLLRQIESGARTLASTARTLGLPEWQSALIARTLVARRRSPELRRRVGANEWSRSLAFELDDLQRIAEEREFAVKHFNPAGFVGKRSHLDLLLSSVGSPVEQNPWNNWRRRHSGIRPDLRGARLTGLDLRGLNLNRVRLNRGDLSGSQLRLCNLAGADLQFVHMRHTDLSHASLRSAKLNQATIEASLLVDTDLSGADLRDAVIIECLLNRANLRDVKLTRAMIWGVGAWDLQNTDNARHGCNVVVGGDLDPNDYSISKPGEILPVDNIECAHVIELLANNEKIGEILRLASSRLVLLLGRFEGDQAVVLDALKDALPKHKYAPIKFDFEQGRDRDLIETVTTLATLSRFVIADLTEPRSIPLESQAIVPDVAVPFVPIVRGQRPFSMFSALQRKYFWVVPTVVYRSEKQLVRSLKESIIDPAEKMVQRLRRLKNPISR